MTHSTLDTAGRVRFHAESGIDGKPEIGITLGRTEYIMPLTDALALASRITLTAVDKETRYAD